MIRRVRYGAGTALVLLLALSACSPSADPGPGTSTSSPPPTSPSPSVTAPTTPDPTAIASVAVLQAYLDFQHAVADAQRTANAHSKKLERYGVDKALAQAQAGLLQLGQSGVVFRGEPQFDPEVTSLNTSSSPATAVVTDCVDSTNWTPVKRATGKSVLAPGQNLRVVNVATLTDYPGHWVVRTLTIDRDKTC